MMKTPSFLKLFSLVLLLAITTSCGGGGSSAGTDDIDGGGNGNIDDGGSDVDDTIDLAKLVGTPFENLENGDDFDRRFFLCGDFRTETVDTLPIKIFAALFTASEEEEIQAGIDIANTAMGPTDEGGVFYELTDTWTNDVRVIYPVTRGAGEYDARVLNYEWNFDDKQYARKVVPDWAIEVHKLDDTVIAHELGHAAGIFTHALIDYVEDTFSGDNLEEDSIMAVGHSRSNPALGDYTFMMQMQGQILLDHLGQKYTVNPSGYSDCP